MPSLARAVPSLARAVPSLVMYLPPSLPTYRPIKKGSLILLKIFSDEVQVEKIKIILDNFGFRFFQLEKNPILFEIFEIFAQNHHF